MFSDDTPETKQSHHHSAPDAVEGEAYMDQMISADGFSRTATGAVKFHKDTKKRRAMEMDQGDEDEPKPTSLKDIKARRPRVVKLGREFKAKVNFLRRFKLSANGCGEECRRGHQEGRTTGSICIPDSSRNGWEEKGA
jgi:hypothetical protein